MLSERLHVELGHFDGLYCEITGLVLGIDAVPVDGVELDDECIEWIIHDRRFLASYARRVLGSSQPWQRKKTRAGIVSSKSAQLSPILVAVLAGYPILS